jgi:hypothetical protein
MSVYYHLQYGPFYKNLGSNVEMAVANISKKTGYLLKLFILPDVLYSSSAIVYITSAMHWKEMRAENC